jgi:hypothetical protein
MTEPAVRHTQTRTVGLVASHREWRSELARYVQDHVTGLKIRVLRDPRAVDDDIDVVLIDDSSTFLNRAALRRLTDAGVAVIGIYDPAEQQGHGQKHLTDLGIDDVAVASIPTAELVELVMAVTDIERTLPDDAALASIVDGSAIVTARTIQPADTSGRGILFAVGGPAVTAAVEVAVGLAASLSVGNRPTVVVDVDEITPAVAARLGYRLEPTVLDASDIVRHGDADLTTTLTAATDGAKGHVPFHVIAGIANPDDWELLGRARCEEVLEGAQHQWRHVVAVCGPRLESMPHGVERYGASQAAITSADVAMAVVDPSPIGILHALDWLIEARRLRGGRPVWVAFAGHPKSSVQRADLVDTLRREAGDSLIAGIVFVPLDAQVADACWDARLVTGGRFARSMDSLAAALTVDGPGVSRWRNLRIR